MTTSRVGTTTKADKGTPASSRPASPTDRGAATRRHILAVATEQFLAHGYDGTSLNDVIRAAGITKGAFYHHFPSKQALALEVVDYQHKETTKRVMQVAAQHPRATDQLRAIAEVVCDMKGHTGDQHSSFQIFCTELREDVPDLGKETAQQTTMWVDLGAAVIARAQDEGDIHADVAPRAVAEVLVTLVMGAEHISSMLSGGADFRERVVRSLDLFFEILRPAGKR